MNAKPIYVEIDIDSEMDKLWEATQTPSLHEQWDLRFSSITYLPSEENEPQEFSYKTKIVPGWSIEGWGATVGSHSGKDGARTSSLHFGTDDSISIIKEGKGYWQYKQKKDSITFLTQYTYNVNFGRVGHVFDRFLFRPLIGWATALSFDVLKRWLEKGETPTTQYTRFFSSWLISFLFFFVWTYHGLIPKLLYRHPEELSMIQKGLPFITNQAEWTVIFIGTFEVLFGFIWLFYQNKRKLFSLQIIIFPLLTFGAILAERDYLIHPFNPLTFNLSLLTLSIIGFLLSKDIPSATSCKRQRERD